MNENITEKQAVTIVELLEMQLYYADDADNTPMVDSTDGFGLMKASAYLETKEGKYAMMRKLLEMKEGINNGNI